MANIREKISEYKDILLAALSIIGVIIALLNLWILNTIAPFANHLSVLDTKVQAIEDQHKNILANGVTRDFFVEAEQASVQRDADITHRLDIISNRLDTLIAKTK